MLVPSMLRDNFVDDIVGDIFLVPFNRKKRFPEVFTTMNADVIECDNEYQVDLELPGFEKEDIKAELNHGYLTIHAVHTECREEKNERGNYIQKERYSGRCQRSFYVGEHVTQDEIDACFTNGLLKLRIPKKQISSSREQNKYIPIE